jgi:hypothetical protein
VVSLVLAPSCVALCLTPHALNIKAILHMVGRLSGTAMLLPGFTYLVLRAEASALALVGKAGLHLHWVWDCSIAGARSSLHRLLFAAIRSSALEILLLRLFQGATIALMR